VFIIAFVIALMVNYPNQKDQQSRIAAHASRVILVATMLFAAGIFTGVLYGTGMIEDMALAFVNLIPESMGRFLPVLVAITSMPLRSEEYTSELESRDNLVC